MSESNPLFKVTFDESAVHAVFDSIEAHLKLHDEQIAELQRMLKECCTQKDLEQLRNDIKDDNEKQMKDLSDALSNKIDENAKKQAEEIADKMKEINDQMKEEMNRISDEIESKIGDTIQNKIDEDAAKKAAALEEEKAKQEEKEKEERAKQEEEKARLEEEQKNKNGEDGSNTNGENGSNANGKNGSNANGENGSIGQKGDGEDDDDSNLTEGEKLKKTREQLKELKKIVDENRNYIQTISNSYASVNKTEAELGPSLQRTLDTTSETISRNFKRIFDFIKSFSPNMNSNQNGESSNRPLNGNNGVRGNNGFNGNNYPIDGPYPPEINLSDLNFVCSEVPASFKEVPQLPEIYKFQTLPESVQYLYDSIPKLQGYLRAMHDKLSDVCTRLGMDDDNSNENDSTKNLNSSFDPSAYDNLVASVRKALNEMSADIDELRRNKKGLSRQEVMDIIRSMMNTHEDFNSDETAVGYVRCIACGREMRQVSGAMTEEQATRKLGYAANSIAVDRSGAGTMEKSIGQVYGNTQGDTKFIDSPRSIRPPKRKSGMSYKTTSPR